MWKDEVELLSHMSIAKVYLCPNQSIAIVLGVRMLAHFFVGSIIQTLQSWVQDIKKNLITQQQKGK